MKLVLCCRFGDLDKNHIAIFSADGKKLREIYGSRKGRKQLIRYPYRVVKNGTNFCIVNLRRNVVAIDESEFTRWVYDGSQAKQSNAFEPFWISCAKYRNLLVPDYRNHCVHYIDKDGKLLQIILTMGQIGLMYPWGICVDDDAGQVWVGNPIKDIVIANYIKYM